MDLMRELKLNCMKIYQFHNERAAKAARDWVCQFKLPLRTVARGKCLELGANSSHIVSIALRLIKAHGFVVRREVPWTLPIELHEHYVSPHTRDKDGD
jgi:hypothetical protein